MVYSTAQLNHGAFSEVSTTQATEPLKCASYIMEWSWYGMPVNRKSHVRIVKASMLWGVHQFSLQKCLQAKTDEVVRSYMTLATFRMNLTMSLAIDVEAKAVFTLGAKRCWYHLPRRGYRKLSSHETSLPRWCIKQPWRSSKETC